MIERGDAIVERSELFTDRRESSYLTSFDPSGARGSFRDISSVGGLLGIARMVEGSTVHTDGPDRSSCMGPRALKRETKTLSICP